MSSIEPLLAAHAMRTIAPITSKTGSTLITCTEDQNLYEYQGAITKVLKRYLFPEASAQLQGHTAHCVLGCGVWNGSEGVLHGDSLHMNLYETKFS